RVEDALPTQLERRLAGRGARTVEVLNFGVPGASLEDSVARLRQVAARWQPDLVLFFLYADDLEESLCHSAEPRSLLLGLLAWKGTASRPSGGRRGSGTQVSCRRVTRLDDGRKGPVARELHVRARAPGAPVAPRLRGGVHGHRLALAAGCEPCDSRRPDAGRAGRRPPQDLGARLGRARARYARRALLRRQRELSRTRSARAHRASPLEPAALCPRLLGDEERSARRQCSRAR